MGTFIQIKPSSESRLILFLKKKKTWKSPWLDHQREAKKTTYPKARAKGKDHYNQSMQNIILYIQTTKLQYTAKQKANKGNKKLGNPQKYLGNPTKLGIVTKGIVTTFPVIMRCCVSHDFQDFFPTTSSYRCSNHRTKWCREFYITSPILSKSRLQKFLIDL